MAAPDLDYANTIHDALGIDMIEGGPDRVVLEMDITERVHQPMGLLHGGASAVVAESAASIGGFLSIDASAHFAVGVELNISHLRAKRDGRLRATATPLRKGRSIQVWNVDLTDERGERIAVARCTLAVRPTGNAL